MLRFLGLYRPPIKAFFSLVGCEIGQNACYLSTSQSYIGANNQTVTGKGKTRGKGDRCSWMDIVGFIGKRFHGQRGTFTESRTGRQRIVPTGAA